MFVIIAIFLSARFTRHHPISLRPGSARSATSQTSSSIPRSLPDIPGSDGNSLQMWPTLISNGTLLCQVCGPASKFWPRRCMTSSIERRPARSLGQATHSNLRTYVHGTDRSLNSNTAASRRSNHTMASFLPAELADVATKVANLLKSRGETVTVCETV